VASDVVRCVVCGGPTDGTAHVSLALFAVWRPSGGGMWFEPEEEPNDCESWEDATFARDVHVSCVQNYFEGVVAEAEFHARKEKSEP
jgi:hypothetical protein